MTRGVEVDRIDLTEEQALTVKSLSAAIHDYQARYGQNALSINALRAQFEQELLQRQREGDAVMVSLQEATQSLQNFSVRLSEELGLDLNDGVWALDVDTGQFIQTKDPSEISTKRAVVKKEKTAVVKKRPAKRAVKKTRSRSRKQQ
jgi:hypothetical protein